MGLGMGLGLWLGHNPARSGGGGGGSSAVAFVTTNGTSKHANITLSNSNLTEVGSAADGATQMVRADTAKTGKRQFEVTVDVAGVAKQVVGVDQGDTDLSADLAVPGTSVAHGVVLTIPGSGGYQIHKNGVNTQGNTGGAPAVGDVITVEYDSTAGSVSFYLTHSGSTSQLGATETGVSLSSWYAIVGGEYNTQRTANFGGSAFTHALSSGYSAYQT
jgi:hypothetical protein